MLEHQSLPETVRDALPEDADVTDRDLVPEHPGHP